MAPAQLGAMFFIFWPGVKSGPAVLLVSSGLKEQR